MHTQTEKQKCNISLTGRERKRKIYFIRYILEEKEYSKVEETFLPPKLFVHLVYVH